MRIDGQVWNGFQTRQVPSVLLRYLALRSDNVELSLLAILRELRKSKLLIVNIFKSDRFQLRECPYGSSVVISDLNDRLKIVIHKNAWTVRGSDFETALVTSFLPDTILAAAQGRSITDLIDLEILSPDLIILEARNVGGKSELICSPQSEAMPIV